MLKGRVDQFHFGPTRHSTSMTSQNMNANCGTLKKTRNSSRQTHGRYSLCSRSCREEKHRRLLSPSRRPVCIVGLEKHLVSPEFSMKRAKSKRLVTCAVLLEQACGSGSKAERIVYAAMRLSEWSVNRAINVGDIQHRESRE